MKNKRFEFLNDLHELLEKYNANITIERGYADLPESDTIVAKLYKEEEDSKHDRINYYDKIDLLKDLEELGYITYM